MTTKPKPSLTPKGRRRLLAEALDNVLRAFHKVAAKGGVEALSAAQLKLLLDMADKMRLFDERGPTMPDSYAAGDAPDLSGYDMRPITEAEMKLGGNTKAVAPETIETEFAEELDRLAEKAGV